MKKVPRWLAITVAVLGILVNLRVMVSGFWLLWNWAHLRFAGGPYFYYGYFNRGVAWLLISALCLAVAGMTLWKQNTYFVFPLLLLAVGVVCVTALPELRLDLAMQTTRLLGHADHSLSDWDDSHGRFPADERELREALATRPLREAAIFFQNGQPIPYGVRVVTNATAPVFEPLPPAPGTVVYAVSSDQKEYWLVVTTLRSPVGGPVVIHHVAGDYDPGKVLVMNRKHHNPGEGYQPFIE